MGALTSKPYAFTARPWELRSREAVDYFDSFGSSIRIDLRGLDIMRVLPRVNEALNEEWITDKVRFSYDGLKRQRLVVPLRKDTGLSFVKIGWIESYMLLLKHVVLNSSLNSVNLFVGKLVDINGFYSLIAFFQRLKQISKLNLSVFYAEDPYLSLPRRYRVQYMFPSLKHLEQIDLLLLVGSNIRLESPLLNIRIRKRALTYNLPVFTLGFQSDLTYGTVNLGLNSSAFVSLVEGRHPFLKLWLRKVAPSIFFSYSFNRLRLTSLLHFFKQLSNRFTSTSVAFISINASTSAVFDYGVLNSFERSRPSSVNWLLNNDEICFESDYKNFTVYSGHHGDRNALLSNLVLPFSSSFEKQAAYINTLGLYQESDFILSPPSAVRSDFHFVNSFFFFLNAILNSSSNRLINVSYMSLKHYFSRFMGYALTPLKLNAHVGIQPSLSYLFVSEKFRISNLPITYSMESYYLDNQITRASHVMALAQTRFKRYITNFK